MCWIGIDFETKIKVAKDNIPVTKVVIINHNKIKSYYEGFEYSIGKTYKTKLDLPSQNSIACYGQRSWSIYEGFHSYNSSCPLEKDYVDGTVVAVLNSKRHRHIAGYFPEKASDILGIMSCIIPKDSIYYENEYGEIVSDTIKPIYCYKIKDV